MLYSHLEVWTDKDGSIWHALSRPGTRDLSMGVLREYEVPKMVAWAKSHRMTINDKRVGR